MTYLGRDFESNKPSAEEIMAQNPEVVVLGGIYQNKHIVEIESTEPYKFLDAVENNQILSIPVGFVMWEQNSIVLPLFIYDQANKLYPDLFDFDIVNLTKTSYESYFDVTLTNQQIEYMLNGLCPNGTQMYD
jgi:iron complex transport system substrate-binding protein